MEDHFIESSQIVGGRLVGEGKSEGVLGVESNVGGKRVSSVCYLLRRELPRSTALMPDASWP